MHTPAHRSGFTVILISISASLSAQTIDQQVKAVDQQVKIMDTHNCATCLVAAGKDTVVTPTVTMYPDLTAHWHDGKPERITAIFQSDAGKKWEAVFYFSNDSLIYVYSEYAIEIATMGPGFYVVDFSIEHYYNNTGLFYTRSAGVSAGLPLAYKDAQELQQYAMKWYALARTRKP